MNFFRLIADFMRALLEFPLRFISGLKQWRQQRTLLQLSTRDVTTEVKEAKGLKGFFKKLGKIFLYVVLLVVVCLFFWLLYWLNNDVLVMQRILGGVPWLRPFWLPILVVLCLVTFWFAIRLWRLL